MSKQYPGGIISKTPPVPSGAFETSTAPGIWTLEQQAYWQKLGQWPTAGNSQFDPQFNYVTMLLHGDGTNGAQNNTFLDSSTNNFSITRNGNTTQGSFSPYGSNWSNNFDGSSALSIGSTTPAQFGSDNWTVEFYVNFSNVSSTQIFIAYGYNTATTRGWQIYKSSSGAIRIAQSPDGSTNYDQSLGTPTLANGVWYHFAVVRNGSTITLYVNGTATGTTATAYSIGTSPTQFKIGVESISYFSGYLSNIRINKGTAVYTGNFTPSTTPLTAISGTSLLTCQSNRFVDNSSSASAITVHAGTPTVQRFNPFGTSTAYDTSVIGGSGYFDGTGDYLTTPSTAGSAFGTGDYTLEAWANPNVQASSYAGVLSTYTASGGVLIEIIGGVWSYYDGVNHVSSGVTATIGAWAHIALSRSSGTLRFFVNGVVTNSTSNSFNASTSNPFTVGSIDANGYDFNGYISDARVVKGTAVYTATFTPPTAPLTAITNTQLLTKFTNGAIFDNAMMNDLETVGNAQISTSVKKYGTGSIAFDGTDDRLVQSGSPQIAFGTGDFTVECWIYSLDVSDSTQRGFLQTSGTAGGLSGSFSNGVTFVFGTPNGTGTINAIVGGTNYASAGGTVATSTWYHIAVTRASGAVKLFVNGTSVASGTGNTTDLSGKFICIGGYYSTSYLYNGYIDDLRITKGYARYTANFTPPIAAFQNIGPT